MECSQLLLSMQQLGRNNVGKVERREGVQNFQDSA